MNSFAPALLRCAVLLLLIVLAAPKAQAQPYNCATDQSEISQAVCEALVALYTSTNGAGWRDNDDWLMTSTPCSWYGVACSGGQVTGLDLLSNDLMGPIPAQIEDLTALQELDLGGNQLTSIPEELGNLSNLLILDLSGAGLTSIPGGLGNLANLQELNLEDNQLTSIPSQLGMLVNLQELDLEKNQLTGIPSELGNLANLQFLSLRDNQLSAFPSAVTSLTNLTRLLLSLNQMTGSIPSSIGNLVNLTLLDLSATQLNGSIPSSIGNLTGLTILRFFNTPLTGAIPTSLGNLTSLTELDLRGTDLSGSIPPELGNMTSLRLLYLNDLGLNGPIPPELGNLSNLVILFLSGNDLTGSIPPALGNLGNLTQLLLGGNDLTGPIPSALGNLTNLSFLSLNDNQLDGSIPTALGNLSNLTLLLLNGNQLNGSVPSNLGNLTKLRSLNLFGNQLVDGVPLSVAQLCEEGFSCDLTSNTSLCIPDTPAYRAVDTNGDNDGDIGGLAFDAGCMAPVPVELTNFAAALNGGAVVLSWETASETINAGFFVERRVPTSRGKRQSGERGEEDETWQQLGFVEGRGTTTAPQAYRFTDQALPFEATTLVYRLKQIDFDGAFEYSPAVEVALSAPTSFALEAAYPNPFNPSTTIRYALPTESEVKLSVYDVLGREVAVLLDGRQEAGRHVVVWEAGGLPSGVYFYRIEAGAFRQARRVVLVK